MTNILGPTDQEILMRARADLRLGIPIVLTNQENDAIVAPLDVLSQTRLDQLKSIDDNPFILITARREDIKAMSYRNMQGRDDEDDDSDYVPELS